MQILCFRKPLQVANFQPIDWSLFCVFSLLLVSLLWNVLLFCGPAMLHLSNTSASLRWGQKVAKEKGNMEKEKGSFPHVPLSACNSGLPRELWHINNEVPLLLRRRTIYRFFQHLQAICLWSWIWMCIFQDIAALCTVFWLFVSPGTHFLVFPRAGSSLSVQVGWCVAGRREDSSATQVPPQMKQRVKVMEDKGGVGVGREYLPFITV